MYDGDEDGVGGGGGGSVVRRVSKASAHQRSARHSLDSLSCVSRVLIKPQNVI